jgi:two-component system response regulator AtoC
LLLARRRMTNSLEAETKRASVYRSSNDRGDRRLVVYGPGTFAAYPLPARGTITLGRSTSADVNIDDPQVSRRHACLYLDAGVELEDLGSANGTRCRNLPVASHERRAINPGDVIAIGASLLVVQAGAGPLFLWTAGSFLARLARECADAARGSRELALLHVSSDTPEPLIEDIVRGALSPDDVVAALAPGRYDLLLPRRPVEAAEQLRLSLAQQLRDHGLHPALRLSRFPGDGATAEALLAHGRGGAGEAARVSAAAASNQAMARLDALVERVAPGNINILLLGETGVGKEVLAERIHRLSPRGKHPLLRLHCAAVSESLFESELFGHERGAFTGALKTKRGLLETADGGTIFLDEVGELPLAIQVKLLRVIEDRKVQRVGGLTAQQIDVRFVAATNRNLEAEIARGAFRQDLYFRLNGISLVIPPLRERPAELEPLARHFLEHACAASHRPVPSLSPAALAQLRSYAWPGNIRELRNLCERALLLCSGDVILPEHFSMSAPDSPFTATSAAPADTITTGALPSDERERVIEALARCAGNQSRAAKLLGISRKTLVARLDAFGLPRPRKPRD